MSAPGTPFGMLLDLRGREVLVVGGGRVAARKVGGLLEAGAAVRVVAPGACEELRRLAAQGRLRLALRPAAAADLDGVLLAFLTANDPAVNEELAADARARGVLVNQADRQGGGDFQVPATASRGPVRVMVSTGGRSPALARALRERLEEVLAEGWDRVAEGLEGIRQELKRRVVDPEVRRRFWERFPDEEGWQALRAGDDEMVREGVARCLSSLSA